MQAQEWGPVVDWDASQTVWVLELLRPAQNQPQRRAAMAAVDVVLSSRRIVAAVQGGTVIPLGFSATLVLAMAGDRMMAHDEAGQLTEIQDVDSVLAVLSEHTGAWVLDDDAGGVISGDEDAYVDWAAKVEAGSGNGASVFAPSSDLGIHLGEDSADHWGIMSHKTKSSVVLHGDAAVIPGPDRLELMAVDIQESKAQALSLRHRGGWLELAYYSEAQMRKKVRWYNSREPLLAGPVGIAVTLYPASAPLSGGAKTAPWTAEQASAQSPAQRLAMTLVEVEFVPGADQIEDLAEIAGPQAAERIVTALRACALGLETAPTGLQNASWLPQLAAAVAELGFDPQWVGVVAGTAEPPAGGVPVKPLGLRDSLRTGPTLRETLKEGPTLRETLREENARDWERQQALTGWRRRLSTRSWPGGVRVFVALVELLLTVAILVFQPLPWGWTNYVLAGVLLVEALGELWDTRARRNALRAADAAEDSEP